MDFISGLPDNVGRQILGFLDVPTLVQKKVICRSWCRLFTNTVEQKATVPKPFESGEELRSTVEKYTRYKPADAEAFATTYGWPIGRWNVYNVEDFHIKSNLNPSGSVRMLTLYFLAAYLHVYPRFCEHE